MTAPPRLHVLWHVELHGEDAAINDLEKLEHETKQARATQPVQDARDLDQVTGALLWKVHGHRFGGGGKKNKRAFDEFCARVGDGVTKGDGDASGDAYAALRRDASAHKTAARRDVEQAFGAVAQRDWKGVVDAFEALRAQEVAAAPEARGRGGRRPSPTTGPKRRTRRRRRQRRRRRRPTTSARPGSWASATRSGRASALDVALGVLDAAKKSDAEMQGALMELLGFGDAALTLMGELCEKKAAVAAVDARDVRAIVSAMGGGGGGAAPSRSFAAPPSGGAYRQGGSVRIGGEKKQSQRSKKQQRKARAARTGPSEAADYLEALGFDERYLAQERSLGLQKNVVEERMSHAEDLLGGAEREYRETRSGLPAGAEKFYGEGYEEVEIPPPKALPPPGPGELRQLTDCLPPWAVACFPKSTKALNRVQSAVFDVAFNSQKNLLVCAPTGAGKTNVALFTRLVYVAPLKALAQEVVDKFKERLAPLGMIVKELTGDAQLSKKDADAAHVLVVTPEKWDVVTRKQGGGGGGDSMGSLASRCRLLIVDEIHLLAEERGAVLECVVARTTRLVESSQSQARLVGLSATLPNYEDVGSFLGCADDSVFFFGPEFRPVPLKQTFVGVTETKRFQKLVKLDDLAFDVALSAVDRGHQAMIFVHSRRETFKTAMALRDRANRDGRDGAFKPAEDLGNLLKPFAPALAKCKHKELREAAEAGFGLHHAGMCRADRSLSERMFAAGAVRVLCCTATLAWGVNLPAHAVICKGTDVYDPQRGGHVDLSMLDVLQIFGRAGRPQFDDFGEATLLTTQKALPDYLRKLARAAPIESCLPARLADAINAEVAAGTVASLKDAGRFLAVRLRKNPLAYGCPYDQAREDPGMGRFRETLLRDACKRLDESRMCRYDRRSGAVAGTEVGRVGSHFYLRHESVREFNERLRQHATDADILVVVCSAYEFEQLKPRSDEVAELDRLRESEVCCPVRSDELFALADEPAGKAATLLQAHVSRAPFSAFTLASDAAYAVERRLWWFQHPVRQLADLEPNLNERRRKFPEDALRQLEAKRLTVDRILGDLNGDPREVGSLVRNNAAGASLVAAARKVPSVTLEADVKPITRTVLRVTLTVTPTYHWEPRTHGLGPEPWWVWVEDARAERIHHFELVLLKPPEKRARRGMEPVVVAFTMAVKDPLPPQFFARAQSDRWVGASAMLEIRSSSTPCIAPTATCSSAPDGSGKTCLAELAIFKLLNDRGDQKLKAVYVAPLKALARERLKDWRKKFGEKLGLSVLELTGDATPDARALRDADVLITTPEKWDGVTRQWRRRDYARHAALLCALLVIDEIHLLGEDRGPVIEAIVSRARFISEQADSNADSPPKVRIVGLSTALANAHDLAAWLGCDPKTGLFNFRPAVRPVAMEAHVAGFAGKHYCPRMATMNKPCYAALREHAAGRPALVFVASRRQTRLTALDLIALAAADDDFGGSGSGLWVGDDERDRDVVEKLFERGAIRVLVCTATLAWGVNFPARLVVIKGTEFFDGKLGKYVDFPITDVLQMMGRAGRPQFDDVGVACIFVHAPKKEFYKKFLYEPFPVDCVAWLKWTYLFRRLTQNPSYYHLSDDPTPDNVDAYLEALAEATLDDLDHAGAVELDGSDVHPATLGQVASYYYLDYKTTQRAALTVDDVDEKLGGADDEALAVAFLCDAEEFGELPVRHNEDGLNADLARELLQRRDDARCLEALDERGFDDAHVKAQLLVHARLRDGVLPIADYATDTRSVFEQTSRVLAALIDVVADAGALKLTLALCTLSQALNTSCAAHRDELCQLPGVDDDDAKQLRRALKWNDSRKKGVADLHAVDVRPHVARLVKGGAPRAMRFADALPRGRAALAAELKFGDGAAVAEVGTFEAFECRVALRVPPPRKRAKNDRRLAFGFWLILADGDELVALKRVTCRRQRGRDAAVQGPDEVLDDWALTLYAVADAARGFDAELALPGVRVVAGAEEAKDAS
ncbi:hypothetical protein JL720_5202 [Aureococcus anophagefferens]|nr:hypothetical protein JL720_5202 [Aureococcus anophagefferens]